MTPLSTTSTSPRHRTFSIPRNTAVTLFSLFLAAAIGSSAAAWYWFDSRPIREAERAYLAANYGLAMAWTEQYRKKYPTSEKANRLLARCIARVGDPLQALRIYTNLSITEAEDIFLVGLCHARSAQYAKAFEKFKQALELDPTISEARRWLVIIYHEGGGLEQAIKEAKLLAQDPKMGNIGWSMLGELYLSYGQLEQARQAYENISDLSAGAPSLTNARLVMRDYLDCLIRLKDAKRAFEILPLLGNVTSDPTAMRLRAQLHVLRGDNESAERDWKIACRLDPSNPATFLQYGEYLLDRSRFKDAVVALKEAERLDPNNANIHQRLTVVYRQLNDKAAADYHAEKTKQLRVGEKTKSGAAKKT